MLIKVGDKLIRTVTILMNEYLFQAKYNRTSLRIGLKMDTNKAKGYNEEDIILVNNDQIEENRTNSVIEWCWKGRIKELKHRNE